MEDDVFLGLTECAEALHTSVQTIRRLIDKGKLPGERLSAESPRRVKRSDLVQYAIEHKLTLDWSKLPA